MLKLNRTSSIGLLAALGLCATAATASAQQAPSGAVILNTVSKLIVDSPNGPADKPVSRCTGAGAMDPQVSFDNKSGDIFMVWTNTSGQNNNNGSQMQGAISIAQLSATGLNVTLPTEKLPTLNGDRPHMRPNAAIGTNFLLDVFASEDNGANNNPQAVAWVFDRAGKMLPIANSTRNNATKPTNLVTLSGQQDNQQRGPHSICPLGVNAAGEEGFLMGVQRNNQQAQVMRVNVKVVNGQATVTVPFLKTIVQNAQHNRPQIACPTAGPLGATAVMTTVEANTQPANIGVRAVLVDTNTGKVLQSKLIAKSDPNNKKYAVQPTAVYISDSVVGIQWQEAGRAQGGAGNNGNGHARNGANLSMLTTLKVANDGSAFTQLDQASRVASYQRHASAYSGVFGAGAGTPAAAVISGSSDGLAKGLVQIVPIDPSSGKIGAIDPTKVFEVSKLSDVANLPARGKRNPNDQARGFINGLHGLKNPGYQQANGFMPEVSTFTISTVAGLKDALTSNRDSLFLSLIPATWDPAVAQTTPGGVKDPAEVPPGPSPRTQTPPSDPGTTGGNTSGGASDTPGFNDDGTGSDNTGSSTGSGSKTPGFGDAQSSAGGCSVSTTKTDASSLGGLALMGLGAAFLSFRRKNAKKEQ
jgi:MYXO-CTERM domain-containing protein